MIAVKRIIYNPIDGLVVPDRGVAEMCTSVINAALGDDTAEVVLGNAAQFMALRSMIRKEGLLTFFFLDGPVTDETFFFAAIHYVRQRNHTVYRIAVFGERNWAFFDVNNNIVDVSGSDREVIASYLDNVSNATYSLET